jgi:heme-degrading monooxygenase HmoA
MTGQPGLIRARLYRCLDTDAELRFINLAEWQHRDALQAATATAAFRASTQRMLHAPACTPSRGRRCTGSHSTSTPATGCNPAHQPDKRRTPAWTP